MGNAPSSVKVLSKSEKFLSDLIIHNKYAGHNQALNRRNTWEEKIGMLEDVYIEKFPHLSSEIVQNFNWAREKKVLPSMRSIQFAGLPLKLNPVRIFNCCYAPVDHHFFFAEAMFLLLSGSGLGFSVRKHHVEKLPMIKKPGAPRRFLISDSIEGWSDSIRQLIYAYVKNNPKPIFDYGDIRKKGTPIKKTGGIAPGPEKLKVAHEKIDAVLNQAIGRRLKTIEAFDIMNYLSDVILAGGIREAAMICLFDIDDVEVMTSKGVYKVENGEIIGTNYKEDGTTIDSWTVRFDLVENQTMNINCYNGSRTQTVTITNQFGDWDLKGILERGELPFYYLHPQRGRSNISVAGRRDRVTKEQFLYVLNKTEESKCGEPGWYWTSDDDSGTNPCVETWLRAHQFCNLSTFDAFDVTTQEELNNRARVAAFFGTLQASMTDFHYLRPIWKSTTEKDALLGVSMTGIASGNVLKLDLEEAAKVVLEENARVAKLIGINQAARTTCIKPEGSGTPAIGRQGSGIHGIHDYYYLRNVRVKKKEPVYQYLLEVMPDFVADEFKKEDVGAVVSIPMKAPEGSITRHESMMDMLARIKKFTDNWIKPGHRDGLSMHNVSATVSVKDDEWASLADWMWENRESYNGISLLPFYDHIYKQAPFESITKDAYDELMYRFPESIDLTKVVETSYEQDMVSNVACAGGACEV